MNFPTTGNKTIDFCKKGIRIEKLVPISSTFYKQLLRAQIPKAQKDSQVKQLFALLGSARVKAVPKNIDEIDPCSFYFSSKILTRNIFAEKRFLSMPFNINKQT